MVRGLRPVQLERPEQSLGDAGWCRTHNGDSVSGSRRTAGCVRESPVCFQLAGQLGEGRGQLDGHDLRHKITLELRRFIEGDLEKKSEAIKVVRPNLNRAIFPGATNEMGWMN